MTDEKKNGTALDFTGAIAAHETAKGAERVAHENAYAAVLIAASSVDMDRDLLMTRVDRIVGEVKDLAVEALRVRDQHEARLDAVLASTSAAPAPTVVDAPPTIPPTLVHWIRRQIALHPLAADHHPLLTEPNVHLGDLRAWLSAYDLGLPK